MTSLTHFRKNVTDPKTFGYFSCGSCEDILRETPKSRSKKATAKVVAKYARYRNGSNVLTRFTTVKQFIALELKTATFPFKRIIIVCRAHRVWTTTSFNEVIAFTIFYYFKYGYASSRWKQHLAGPSIKSVQFVFPINFSD